ncbi:MAG: hypothetical protein R3C52_15060 [Hyphomonadaceae bacterium]
MNDRVLDIGIPEQKLVETVGVPAAAKQMRLTGAEVVNIGRELFFQLGRGIMPDAKAATALACLIAIKSEADGALFVVPPKARKPADVGCKFVAMPLTTLYYLNSLQAAGTLTPEDVNQAVWLAA